MSNIDWSKAPEGATHYLPNGARTEGWYKIIGDNRLEYCKHDEDYWKRTATWPIPCDAIPRPANLRGWSDPAMWFDAPDWAVGVSMLSNGKIIYTNGARIYQFVGSDDITSFGGEGCFMIDDAKLIATRPTDNLVTAQEAEQAIHGAREGRIDDSTSSTVDVVDRPQHYTQGNVECIDAIESATVNKSGIEAVCTANVIKYLWRYECKNGIEDLKKARWYLNKLIGYMDE